MTKLMSWSKVAIAFSAFFSMCSKVRIESVSLSYWFGGKPGLDGSIYYFSSWLLDLKRGLLSYRGCNRLTFLPLP